MDYVVDWVRARPAELLTASGTQISWQKIGRRLQAIAAGQLQRGDELEGSVRLTWSLIFDRDVKWLAKDLQAVSARHLKK